MSYPLLIVLVLFAVKNEDEEEEITKAKEVAPKEVE